jgi:hypothetical protein
MPGLLTDATVGQQTTGQGGLRKTVRGELIVAESLGRYAIDSLNGNIFHANTIGAGVTLAAANALGTAVPAAGAAQPILGLLNPASSGVNLVINKALVATLFGTPAGGFMFGFLPNTQAALYTGTQSNKGVKANTLTSSSLAVVLPNLAVTGTTVQFVELKQLGGPAAVAAGAGVYTAFEEVAGDVIIPPGAVIGIFAVAAGTSHLVKASLQWAEVPVTVA